MTGYAYVLVERGVDQPVAAFVKKYNLLWYLRQNAYPDEDYMIFSFRGDDCRAIWSPSELLEEK